MSDLVREAFENWWKEWSKITPTRQGEGYAHVAENVSFSAWQAALSANGGEAVGWLVSRKGDGTFPRFYFDKGLAEDMVKEVELPPSATMSPVYTHPAPPSVAVPEPVHELIYGIRSINRAAHHLVRVTGDDEPCYYQRDEWIKWVLELADKAENAVSAPSPDHSGDANKMVAMLREIVDMWDGPRYSLQMMPLIDRARTLIAGYEATPSVPENEGEE